MSTKHKPRYSPVPWRVDERDSRFPAIRDADGEVVLAGSMENPLALDNARLIVLAVNKRQMYPGRVTKGTARDGR